MTELHDCHSAMGLLQKENLYEWEEYKKPKNSGKIMAKRPKKKNDELIEYLFKLKYPDVCTTSLSRLLYLIHIEEGRSECSCGVSDPLRV